MKRSSRSRLPSSACGSARISSTGLARCSTAEKVSAPTASTMSRGPLNSTYMLLSVLTRAPSTSARTAPGPSRKRARKSSVVWSPKRPPGADQDAVHRRAQIERHDLREHRLQGRQDGAIGVEGDLVLLEPLREDPVVAQPAIDQAIEVLREDVGDAHRPRMRRLGDDHVVGVVRGEQDVARVVLVEAQPRVAQRIVVDVQEES